MCDFIFSKQEYKVYVSLLPWCVILHHLHELPLDPLYHIEVLVPGLPAHEQQVVPLVPARGHGQVVHHRGHQAFGALGNAVNY